MSDWLVYLLECNDGSYYCGCTNNLERRVERHNAGRGARYTRARLPVRVVASMACESHSDALRLEAFIKKIPRKNKIEVLVGEKVAKNTLNME